MKRHRKRKHQKIIHKHSQIQPTTIRIIAQEIIQRTTVIIKHTETTMDTISGSSMVPITADTDNGVIAVVTIRLYQNDIFIHIKKNNMNIFFFSIYIHFDCFIISSISNARQKKSIFRK